MIACQNGHSDRVDLLLHHGCDVNAWNKDNWTALMFACQNGHTDCVDRLLRNDYDVTACDERP